MLGRGFHLSPTADQDNHYKTWGTLTNARTGLIANALTRHDLLSAMRSGHSYASEDRNLRIICWAQKKLAGETVSLSSDGTITIALRIEDPDEDSVDYNVEIKEGSFGSPAVEDLDSVSLSGNTADGKVFKISGVAPSSESDYLILKITQADANSDDRVWLAPIYISH
jgi:hypothetical protein